MGLGSNPTSVTNLAEQLWEIYVTSWPLWCDTELNLFFTSQKGEREIPQGKAESAQYVSYHFCGCHYHYRQPWLLHHLSCSLPPSLPPGLSTHGNPKELAINPSWEGGTSFSLHCTFITVIHKLVNVLMIKGGLYLWNIFALYRVHTKLFAGGAILQMKQTFFSLGRHSQLFLSVLQTP